MGWDFILQTFDPTRLSAFDAVAAAPDFAERARAELDRLVPADARDVGALEWLTDDHGPIWLRALFAETVVDGEEVFFGRSGWLKQYSKKVDDRELRRLFDEIEASVDERMQWCDDVEGCVHLVSPEKVREVAVRARLVYPTLAAVSPEEVRARFEAAKLDKDRQFIPFVLPLLFGFFAWAAERQRGLVISYDGLRPLRAKHEDNIDSDGTLPPVAKRAEPAPSGKRSRAGLFVLVALAVALALFLVLR